MLVENIELRIEYSMSESVIQLSVAGQYETTLASVHIGIYISYSLCFTNIATSLRAPRLGIRVNKRALPILFACPPEDNRLADFCSRPRLDGVCQRSVNLGNSK